jgi:hypothetical protein
LLIPKVGTDSPLEVDFGEPLDYFLLQDAIRVVDSGGIMVNGSVQIDDREMKYHFKPAKPWLPGSYRLQVEARLEDLAGNNFNLLFDRDLQNAGKSQATRNIFEKQFNIY